jgi:hypothetical protein
MFKTMRFQAGGLGDSDISILRLFRISDFV